MKTIRARITKSGQVTMPAEVRKTLGAKLGDDVEFQIDEGSVQVTRPTLTLEDVFGSLKAPRPDFDIDEAIREAKEERAERIMKTVRGE